MSKTDLSKYNISLDLVVSTIINYGVANRQLAQDTIYFDPVMNADIGQSFSKEEIKKSTSLQVEGLMHSSKYHAAKDILALLNIDLDVDDYE